MSNSRIEQIIEEIEDYIDRDCKVSAVRSSRQRSLLIREHLDELLRELRMKTPDEIKRYQKILANKRCDPGRCTGRKQML